MPRLLLGHSMGGLMTLNIALRQPDYYNGIGLITPYLDLYNPEMLEKYLPLARVLGKFWPSLQLPLGSNF